MFLRNAPVFLLIVHVTLNEVFSYRLSKFGKQQNIHHAAKQQSRNDPNFADPDVVVIASPPRPIFLNLLVVVDASSYHYHGDDTEHYIREMMNVAGSLWQSASLNANVQLRVAQLHVMKENLVDLELTDHANLSLRRFCRWQRTHFTTEDGGGLVNAAILITRIDIQIGGNYDATGIAYTKGVCDGRYRCALCEDKSPMVVSHTIAHEIGHLLGMRHDGDHNACPDRVNIMSGYSTSGQQTFIWSECSQRALAEFLKSDVSSCLHGPNTAVRLPVNAMDTVAMPGNVYDADYQCKMIYGAPATACNAQNRQQTCVILKCQIDRSGAECVTDGRPALQGTSCGPLKWCSQGMCVRRTGTTRHNLGVSEEQAVSVSTSLTNKQTDRLHCRDCGTFPYMDTPAPTTKRDQIGLPVEL